MDPSGARFEFVGREGSTSRDIHLFDGTTMTRVSGLFILSKFFTSFRQIRKSFRQIDLGNSADSDKTVPLGAV